MVCLIASLERNLVTCSKSLNKFYTFTLTILLLGTLKKQPDYPEIFVPEFFYLDDGLG